jgi:hypothetical protein
MADAKTTVKQILDNRRSFIFETPDGDQKTYFIADPSGEDIRKADWNYSKVFNQAMTDEFPTQAQMLEILRGRGIISDEYTADVERARIRLAAALFRLENLDEDADDSDKESLAVEVANYRDTLFRLNQRVNGPLGNTCENLAEDARTEYLTSRIIQYQDGSRIWPLFDDYLKETQTGLCIKSRFEVMLWLQGLDSNFLENSPEQAALRQITQKRLESALEKINETAEEAPAVEEIVSPALTEEPVAKKAVGRPRKKKTDAK